MNCMVDGCLLLYYKFQKEIQKVYVFERKKVDFGAAMILNEITFLHLKE